MIHKGVMYADLATRTSTRHEDEPSNYMTELTQYLSNIMSSVLLGLPDEIKELGYLDALTHAASNILVSIRQASLPPLPH